MVKLDFANAFNSLHRSDMLLSIRDCLPELYAFNLSSYSQLSFLYFGSHVLQSKESPQQGDPLGLLLFYITVTCGTSDSLPAHLQSFLFPLCALFVLAYVLSGLRPYVGLYG